MRKLFFKMSRFKHILAKFYHGVSIQLNKLVQLFPLVVEKTSHLSKMSVRNINISRFVKHYLIQYLAIRLHEICQLHLVRMRYHLRCNPLFLLFLNGRIKSFISYVDYFRDILNPKPSPNISHEM